jgi:hypothetical protein
MARRPSDNPSKSTLRGRKHAALRRDGFSLYPTPLHEDGLTLLIARGHLKSGDDADRAKVGAAIGSFLARALELDELKEPIDAGSIKHVRFDARRAM